MSNWLSGYSAGRVHVQEGPAFGAVAATITLAVVLALVFVGVRRAWLAKRPSIRLASRLSAWADHPWRFAAVAVLVYFIAKLVLRWVG